jgi:glutathione S-transferase
MNANTTMREGQMTQIFLHHYDSSPYSELVRLALGLKGLSWRSVQIPVMGAKPELAPLTGGYRKTPVLQIGADVYCDTARIVDALEALQPKPTLYPAPLGQAARMIAQWSAAKLFGPSVTMALAPVHDKLPPAFWDDRKALFGMSKDAMLAAAPHLASQWRNSLDWLETTLETGQAFLGGDAPGYADLAVYHCIWFAQSTGNPESRADVNARANLAAWMKRVAALGHGTASTATAQDALDAAKAATPTAAAQVDAAAPFAAGQSVTVLTEDPGAAPVTGTLHRYTTNEICVLRDDPQVGTVAVHFPRVGMIVRG